MRIGKAFLFVMFGFLLIFSVTGAVDAAGGSPPPNPSLYSGEIRVGGDIPGDSVVKREGVRNRCLSGCVTAKIGDFTSDAGIVIGGRYTVTVGPPDGSYVGSSVTFHYDGLVEASDSDRFIISSSFRIISGFTLTFPALPTPTPMPTATPTMTPVPTSTPVPTPTPVSTATPVPTATPAVLFPVTYSGTVTYTGPEEDPYSTYPLFARVGSYFSQEVLVRSVGTVGVFEDLILDPVNRKFLNKQIQFMLGEFPANSSEVLLFNQEGSEIDVELKVTEQRKLTPIKVNVAGPVINPSATSVPASSIPATVSPMPKKAAIVVPVAPTKEPPDALAEEDDEGASGGACSRGGRVSSATGAVNTLMLFSPLFLIGGLRAWRKRQP
jgi:hypothetical protein